MNIAILKKRAESAVSYYRLMPLLELARTDGHNVAILPPEHFTVDVAHSFDVLFCHRPSAKELAAIATAVGIGVKVWIDLDDLLWSIHYANPAFTHYTPQEHDTLLRAMQSADVVSCSTAALAEAIQVEFNRSAVVIPNAWNDREGGDYIAPYQQKDPITILYRGSNTHDADVYSHRDAFREYDSVTWQFMGLQPWYLAKKYGGHLSTLNLNPFTSDVLSYFRKIQHMNPQFVIVPLEYSQFNKCKSNIAWIEATMSGAVCIAPKYLPEFAAVPCILYDNAAHLKEIIASIATQDVQAWATGAHQHSVEQMKERYSLSKINQARRVVLDVLAERAAGQNKGDRGGVQSQTVTP